MKKLLLILFTSLSIWGFSQDYKTALGLRGGLSSGLTIKHFVSGNSALEGILASRWRGFNLTGLYEIHHFSAFGVPHLNWYYGFGGHIGSWAGYKKHPWFPDDKATYSVAGADFILGIEYNFKEVPINISADWKPAFNIWGHKGFWIDESALSIRYRF